MAMVLGFVAPSADAATREFYFAPLGGDRGLSQNSVTALVQDTQGFVWVEIGRASCRERVLQVV